MVVEYPASDISAQRPALLAAYRSTVLRSPQHAPLPIAHSLSEVTGPGGHPVEVAPMEADLLRNAARDGDPIGERLIVTGRVMDVSGAPLADAIVEIWQANAAGRYAHQSDAHDAPLDPNFLGAGRCRTDAGGAYRFLTLRPGAYPWQNDPNAWRPAHIHFSVFGPAIATRLITQMYFPGDPLLPRDAIFLSVPQSARDRLIATYDHAVTEPGWALGYRFDIVLRGATRTPAVA